MNDRNGEMQRRVAVPTCSTNLREELDRFRAALRRQGAAPRLSPAGRVALRKLIAAIAAILGEEADS